MPLPNSCLSRLSAARRIGVGGLGAPQVGSRTVELGLVGRGIEDGEHVAFLDLVTVLNATLLDAASNAER